MLHKNPRNGYWVVFIHGTATKEYPDFDMAKAAEKFMLDGKRDRTTKANIAEYFPKENASDAVRRFVDVVLVSDSTSILPKSDVYEAYQQWGGRLERSAFFRTLRKVIVVFPLQLMRQGIRKTYVKGVAFK